jgi:hypothetical protein
MEGAKMAADWPEMPKLEKLMCYEILEEAALDRVKDRPLNAALLELLEFARENHAAGRDELATKNIIGLVFYAGQMKSVDDLRKGFAK